MPNLLRGLFLNNHLTEFHHCWIPEDLYTMATYGADLNVVAATILVWLGAVWGGVLENVVWQTALHHVTPQEWLGKRSGHIEFLLCSIDLVSQSIISNRSEPRRQLDLESRSRGYQFPQFQHLIRLIPWLDLAANRGSQALGHLPLTVRRIRPSRHIYQSISQYEAVYAASWLSALVFFYIPATLDSPSMLFNEVTN